MAKLNLAMVAAMSLNNGIGKDGGLPWKLKGEMSYFRSVTTYVPEQKGARNAVIMGRKTWTSIPPKFRPLANRINIVISRTCNAQDLGVDPESKDVQVFASIQQVLTHLAAHHESLYRIFVIGGAQLYTDLLKLDSSLATVNQLLITRILTPHYECDAFFPEFRTKHQYKFEQDLANQFNPTQPQQPTSLLIHQVWSQASTDSLKQYLGTSCPSALLNSPNMVTSEGETYYQYQLWERR
ncbi:related to Dihydrofolate reductase [Ustilago trichophora]|uniref:Dihydrofolate reductase n=1 Tax=Ustilago trichophora TaxID=86804 RepID=A0A5C3E7F2_9BASI|nr:related to Dihydrofolate reductase [Ustilago trichophora]